MVLIRGDCVYYVLANMKRSNLSGMFFSFATFASNLNPIYDDSGIKVLNFTIQKLEIIIPNHHVFFAEEQLRGLEKIFGTLLSFSSGRNSCANCQEIKSHNGLIKFGFSEKATKFEKIFHLKFDVTE